MDAARDALFAMAEGLDLDSCDVRPGVLPSLFDPNFATLRQPFKEHFIPGVINAVDYDIGDEGSTYHDTDVWASTGAPGGGNNGGKYRNDGVDIESSTDPQGNDFNVGWTVTLEWLIYSVHVTETATYDVEMRVASAVGGGAFRLMVDGVQIGDDIPVANTGGWQNWISVWLRDIPITAGDQDLKFLVRTEGFNINRMIFTRVGSTAVEDDPVERASSRLIGLYPNPSQDQINLAFESSPGDRTAVEIFDMLGRRVYARPWSTFSAGRHGLNLRPDLAPGAYVLRLGTDEGRKPKWMSRRVTVVR